MRINKGQIYYLSFNVGRSGHITSFAIDVTTLEPYKSCGQLANKAQGSALGSLVPNPKCGSPPIATK